jgi:hypothetical protein
MIDQKEEELSLGKQIADKDPAKFEKLVLVALDNFPEVFKRYKDQLGRSNGGVGWRDDFAIPAHNAIYRAISEYHNVMSGKDNVPPVSEDLLRLLLTMQAENASPNIGLDEVDEAISYMRELRTQDKASAVMIAMDGMEWWLQKRRLSSWINITQATDSWDPHEMLGGMLEATQDLGRLGKSTSHAFGESIDMKLPKQDRIPIPNLMGLTTALGGGFARREHTMFISPTGGGKTVMACQISLGLVLQGLKGILVTTEQRPNELEPRIVSAACEIPFDRIVGGINVDTDIPPSAVGKYNDLRARMRDRFWIEDWTEDPSLSVVADLKNMVTNYKRKHGGLDFVVLDWIGGALGSMTPDAIDRIRHLYQFTADCMASLAVQEDLITVSFVQANTQQARNKRKVDMSMIAENKMLGRNATYVFGISAMENDGGEGDRQVTYRDDQWCHCAKGRKSQAAGFKLQRQFHFQRFANI